MYVREWRGYKARIVLYGPENDYCVTLNKEQPSPIVLLASQAYFSSQTRIE